MVWVAVILGGCELKKKKKSYDQIETELRLLKAHCLWDNASKIIAPNLKWAALAVIAKQAANAIGGLSGKITAATIDLQASAAFNAGDAALTDTCDNWPYWIAALSMMIGVASISYGWHQRLLRKQTIMHLAPYKEKYERTIDGSKVSSGLLNDGSTDPDDE